MHQSSSRERRRNPREGAGFFSILTFFFAVDIFKRSKDRELEEDDIYVVTRNCNSNVLGEKIEKQWAKELKKKHASLTKTLFRIFGAEYMCYGMLNLFINTTVMVIRPFATGRLVSYFDSPEMPKWHAMCYAGMILFCGFIQSLYRHYYLYSLAHLGLRLRIALCSLMYRKSLKLTTSSLSQVTNGKIVTLMSKDVQVFDSALLFSHDLWIGLVQLTIMAGIMYWYIGISALVGISFIVLMIPIQVWIGVKTKQMRLRTAAKTDERLRRIQEILTSIKLIKLYTWERYYTKVVNMLRCEEMRKLRAIFYLKSIILSISATSYRVSLILCILTYYLLDHEMTAEKAFGLISCYKSLYFVLSIAIPMSVSQIAEAKSSLKRIKAYLLVEERQEAAGRHIVTLGKVYADNAKAKIGDKIILRGINIEASVPNLIGITGGIGGGKSSFLKMVLQDIDICDGKVVTSGKMSYASQEPWLFPGTIRQNILFGNVYDEYRYDKVLYVCALKRDLKVFPMGDMTVVNDKGLNLSKGQQARINLARAVYKTCDVYLLDDVMSSLDANVSRHIFDRCIKGFLGDKLCFLVCHNEKYLSRTDKILVFDEGTIKAQGTYTDLKALKVRFENTVKVEVHMAAETVEEVDEMMMKVEGEGESDKDLLLQPHDGASEDVYGENKQKGKVHLSVYKKYCSFAGGWFIVAVVLLICAASQLMGIVFDQHIRQWLTVQDMKRELRNTSRSFSVEHIARVHRLNATVFYTYCLLALVFTTLVIAELFSFFTMTVRAARMMHIHVFTRIMGAVISFFDAHLSGNVLNRLSKDMGVIDEFLGYILFESIRTTFLLFVIMGAITILKPVLLVPGLILFGVIWCIRVRFLKASRSLRRLEGVTKAPVIGYLNASLEGLTTIRATGNQDILERQFDRHQDLNSSTSLMVIASQRAFAMWIDVLGNFYNICVVYSFLVFVSFHDNSGNVGFVITQAIGLSIIVQWCIRQWAEVENMMTSVERVLEYADADQEDLTGDDPNNWPLGGKIEYKDVKLQYPMSKKPVLQGINFTVDAGQKVGIVGRTGAGKSSIISALFRLYKCDGSILVDGIEVTDIELPIVRSQISVIPQDPVMFKGTVRTNLDPYGYHTDLELWNALQDVGLKGTVESLGLSSDVDEGGSNWSIGQRQLFCLARAVLRGNRIIVLDEATANIDPATDAFIQTAIKRLFEECTILTIAHRINTVVNSEKVMVIDNGVVVEYDNPQTLINRKRGAFYAVAREAGLVD